MRRLIGLTVTALALTALVGCTSGSDPAASPSGSPSPAAVTPSPAVAPADAVRAGFAALTDRLDRGWRAVGEYHLDPDTVVEFHLEMSTDVRAGVVQYEGGNVNFWGTATQTWVTATTPVWRAVAPDLDEAALDAIANRWTPVPAGELANVITSVDGTLDRFTDIGANPRWTQLGDVRGTSCYTVSTDTGRVWLPVDDPYVTYVGTNDRDAYLSITMDFGVSKRVRPTEFVPWPG